MSVGRALSPKRDISFDYFEDLLHNTLCRCWTIVVEFRTLGVLLTSLTSGYRPCVSQYSKRNRLSCEKIDKTRQAIRRVISLRIYPSHLMGLFSISYFFKSPENTRVGMLCVHFVYSLIISDNSVHASTYIIYNIMCVDFRQYYNWDTPRQTNSNVQRIAYFILNVSYCYYMHMCMYYVF